MKKHLEIRWQECQEAVQFAVEMPGLMAGLSRALRWWLDDTIRGKAENDQLRWARHFVDGRLTAGGHPELIGKYEIVEVEGAPW